MTMPEDLAFQIMFFVLGVLLSIVIPWIPELWRKVIVGVIAFLCIAGALFWMGFQSGRGSRNGVYRQVPITNWSVSGSTIGNSDENKRAKIGEFELSSIQAESSYTNPEKQLTYSWDSPGAFPGLGRLPMRGIQSVISISPLETKYGAERIFCYYTVKYDGHSYSSVEQYIPFDQPLVLVWDFTARIQPYEFGLTEEEVSSLEDSVSLLHQRGVSFTYYATRLGELWQWQELYVGNNGQSLYDPNKLEKILVTCNVSASEGYRGGNAGDEFIFKGRFTFGDVIVYPYEQPK